MITYSFEGITVPLYEHLYRCLKKDIESGLLKAGVRLPSKRAFAKNLGVSTVTVQGAYDQLRSEGYIHSEPKHGYFVEAITRKPANSTVITDSLSEPKPPAQEALPVRFELSGNHTDPECFPFSVWSKLMRETARDRTVLLTRYRTGACPSCSVPSPNTWPPFAGFLRPPSKSSSEPVPNTFTGLSLNSSEATKSIVLKTPATEPSNACTAVTERA